MCLFARTDTQIQTRSHTHIYICISVCLYACLSICLSFFLSVQTSKPIFNKFSIHVELTSTSIIDELYFNTIDKEPTTWGRALTLWIASVANALGSGKCSITSVADTMKGQETGRDRHTQHLRDRKEQSARDIILILCSLISSYHLTDTL